MEKVQFERTKVILGDANDKTAVRCSGIIYLDIDFLDDKGVIQRVLRIKCIIMPTLSVDVIIGWPDIVRKIPKIFIKGFVAALNEAHSEANLTCKLCVKAKTPITKTRANKSALTESATTTEPLVVPTDIEQQPLDVPHAETYSPRSVCRFYDHQSNDRVNRFGDTSFED